MSQEKKMESSTMADMMLVKQFEEVVRLIRNSRNRALQSVNRELIEIYWQVGEYINKSKSRILRMG